MTYPPCNQMIQGSRLVSFAGTVREPFCFSNAQKNRVLLGCPARLTGIFPAKLRVKGTVTLGRASLTSKSSENDEDTRKFNMIARVLRYAYNPATRD